MATDVEQLAAANIRRLRIARKLTQGELAAKASALDPSVNEARVWALEKGRRRMTVASLAALAAALETTPANLLSDTPDDANREVTYLVQVAAADVQQVTADDVTTDVDGWVFFYRQNRRVFCAPVANVLYVRTRDGREAS